MVDWPPRKSLRAARVLLAGALVIGAGAVLGACTEQLAKLPAVGEPDYIPKRPDAPGAFPAVYDTPAPRDDKLLSADERKKLESDLGTLRTRQQGDAAAAAKE
jgi:hypothetical protein